MSSSLKMELQEVVSRPTWVPGTEPAASAKVRSALDQRAASPGSILSAKSELYYTVILNFIFVEQHCVLLFNIQTV